MQESKLVAHDSMSGDLFGKFVTPSILPSLLLVANTQVGLSACIKTLLSLGHTESKANTSAIVTERSEVVVEGEAKITKKTKRTNKINRDKDNQWMMVS